MGFTLDLRALYEQEADAVAGFLRRFGIQGADIEDAVHDTFLTALHRASSFDSKRPIRPWLLGIAFRVAVARVRHGRARERAGDIPDQIDASQNPERGLETRDAERIVHRGLQSLSEEQRAAFVMYDLQGIPVADIAEAMGAPVATTYSRIRLARQAFAEAVRRDPAAGATA